MNDYYPADEPDASKLLEDSIGWYYIDPNCLRDLEKWKSGVLSFVQLTKETVFAIDNGRFRAYPYAKVFGHKDGHRSLVLKTYTVSREFSIKLFKTPRAAYTHMIKLHKDQLVWDQEKIATAIRRLKDSKTLVKNLIKNREKLSKRKK